jgi:hypothetical protein
MIDQVLNRRFVLEQVEDVRAHFEQVAKGDVRRSGGRAPEGAEELAPEDYNAALLELRAAAEREESASSGQPGFEIPPAERRGGETAADIDDTSFFSRDPVISNLQSALEEYFETQESDKIEDAAPATGRRGDTAELPPAADLRLSGYQERRSPEGRRLFERFSVTDVGWVSALVAMGIRRFRNRHPFNPAPATRFPVEERMRILMVGDWGTGITRAQRVAAEMRKVIEDGKAEGIQQHVIHLGDVYYSGWKREYEGRFLRHWPVKPEEAESISSWSVNANHDMYSGGHDYFRTLLGDPRFARHERSSMFHLENPHWRILGIDTAWEDHDLKAPQPEWIREQAKQAEAAGQKLILLSHHQPFSAFESGGEKLVRALEGVMDAGRIHAWFWGHEHRCAHYRTHLGLPFGRCIGHGGVPVYQFRTESDPVPEPAIYEFRGRFKNLLEPWAWFGFAVLDFFGPHIEIRYIDENGELHHREVIGHGPELESIGLAMAGPRMETATQTIRRTPHMDVAPEAPLAPGTEFHVEIYADTREPKEGESSEDIEFEAPAHLAEFFLEVTLFASGHFEILEPPPRTLKIERDREASEKLRAKLRVKTEAQLAALRAELPGIDRGSITAVFAYQGRPCGRVGRIVALRPEAERSEAEKESEPVARIEVDPEARPADMMVTITADEVNDGRQFHCKVVTRWGEYEGPWNLPSRAGDMVAAFMANFTAPGKSKAQLLAALKGAGMRLFEASPKVFQEAYWKLVDEGTPPETLAVVSEEPYFLWELMIPKRGAETRPPLGVQCRVGRWITRHAAAAPQKIALSDSVVIVPQYKGSKVLQHAEAEMDLVRALFPGEAVRPATYEAIRETLLQAPGSLIHFACHGKESSGVDQVLELDGDGALSTTEVEGEEAFVKAFRERRPMVFLNACEVGRLQPSLNGAGGFASTFIALGARGVIAPMWAVKDTEAHEIAKQIYENLQPGELLSELLRRIRERAYEGDKAGEDTWAAYCLYGDPLAAAFPG